MDSGLHQFFLHDVIVQEVGRRFAKFFFKGLGEIRLALDTDTFHDFGDAHVFTYNDLGGFFEPKFPHKFPDGLPGQTLDFSVQLCSAHAHFVADHFYVQIGVVQMFLDD